MKNKWNANMNIVREFSRNSRSIFVTSRCPSFTHIAFESTYTLYRHQTMNWKREWHFTLNRQFRATELKKSSHSLFEMSLYWNRCQIYLKQSTKLFSIQWLWIDGLKWNGILALQCVLAYIRALSIPKGKKCFITYGACEKLKIGAQLIGRIHSDILFISIE